MAKMTPASLSVNRLLVGPTCLSPGVGKLWTPLWEWRFMGFHQTPAEKTLILSKATVSNTKQTVWLAELCLVNFGSPCMLTYSYWVEFWDLADCILLLIVFKVKQTDFWFSYCTCLFFLKLVTVTLTVTSVNLNGVFSATSLKYWNSRRGKKIDLNAKIFYEAVLGKSRFLSLNTISDMLIWS